MIGRPQDGVKLAGSDAIRGLPPAVIRAAVRLCDRLRTAAPPHRRSRDKHVAAAQWEARGHGNDLTLVRGGESQVESALIGPPKGPEKRILARPSGSGKQEEHLERRFF